MIVKIIFIDGTEKVITFDFDFNYENYLEEHKDEIDFVYRIDESEDWNDEDSWEMIYYRSVVK